MSYRCHVCRTPCPPGQSRLVHTVYRDKGGRQEIAAEVPVCRRCSNELQAGVAVGVDLLADLRQRYRRADQPRVEEVLARPIVGLKVPAINRAVRLGGLAG